MHDWASSRELPSAGAVMASPCGRVAMGSPVTALRVMVPTIRRSKFLPHQRATVAVPHDLSVPHAVAFTDGPARQMDCPVMPVCNPMARVSPPVMRPRDMMVSPARVMVRASLVMFANVDPAVARARPRHRWERRRRRQRFCLGRGRRLRLFRHRLPGWGSRLAWAGLLRGRRRLLGERLRGERRSGHPERHDYAGNDDTLHDTLPSQPGRCKQANDVRG